MTRVLVVEDDPRIAGPLQRALKAEGYEPCLAVDAGTAWGHLQGEAFDLIVLDLMLPDMDGLSLCQRLRQAGRREPVLMLTARDTISDRVRGLDAGADDYLVKPFDLEELLARLRALLRRGPSAPPSVLTYGGLQLDPARKEARVEGRTVDLTTREFQLLEYLMAHPQQVFSAHELVARLWGWDGPDADVVRAHLKGLRAKLRAAGASDPVETVRGFGYRVRRDG